MNVEASKPEEIFNPFPGLRPFTQEESNLFFGREGQSKSVLESLRNNNFVAVIGASGSGKSSLIYCGVIPELLSKKDKKWFVVSMRPGMDPINNLLASLKAKYGKKVPEKEFENVISGKISFREWLDMFIPAEESLLLVIDQFEEVFRYKNDDLADFSESGVENFVDLIYHASTSGDRPVSIVLTMRSDFIGECAVFQNLTNLINRSNYLIPQMTRNDFRKAIEGPVAIGGAAIAEDLVDQLLDEVGNNTDQLPVLQHALMRTWNYWSLQNDKEKPITIGDYEAIGRMEKALSDHANEAYDELNEDQRQICEYLFKTITEKGGDNRGVRRPTRISRIAEITRSEPREIIEIAEVFRSKGRTFLTPYKPVKIEANTVIDISHESLMRIWDRLRLWVDEEANSVQMYMKLSAASEQYQAGTSGLWRPPDLQLALNWRETQKPTATWAVQYNPAYERAMVFLDTSEAEFKKEEENKIRLQRRRLRVTRMFSLVLGGIAVVAMGLFLWTRDLQNQAEAQRVEAEQQAIIADQQRNIAQTQSDSAVVARKRAEEASKVAITQSQIAKQQRAEAESASRLAERRRIEAEANAEAARTAEELAQQNADSARAAQALAQRNAELAEKRRMLSIAQSMAVKSTQMRTDTMLKGLLAYQAYNFNEQYEGIKYDPDIFGSVYSGMKFFKGSDYNVFKGHSSSVGSLLAQDGAVISASSEGDILKWHPGDTSATIISENLPTIRKIFFANSSLICLTNGSIQQVGSSSGDEDVYNFPLYTLNDLFYTNEGRYIKVYSDRIDIADNYNQEGETFYKTDKRINVVEFDKSTGILIVALSDGSILYWTNFYTGSQQEPEELAMIPTANWSAINFLPGRNIIAAGTGNSQGAIYLWDINNGNELNSLRGHNAKITGITFSSDGNLMASSSYDGSVNLWHMDDLNTLPIKFSDHNAWVTAVVFLADDTSVISSDKNGNLRVMPTAVESMVQEYCDFLSRTLTESEWQNYVATDIPYNPANCNTQ